MELSPPLLPAARRGANLLLFAVTIFLSAFLLFQVQPIIARMILPWFGGSAAVWTTCMLFFQTSLLLGYLYVHWSLRAFPVHLHAKVHAVLLAASLLLLPIMPGDRWKPTPEANPSAQILLLLAACVGSQYFLLSTTSPLLQAWYARSGKGVLPYRLFALSNLGSMLALISYPFSVVPFLPGRLQGTAWSVMYAVFAALCVASAWAGTQSAVPLEHPQGTAEDTEAGSAPSGQLQLLWVALAACPSALLLGVTNHLTQDVASIPFLWIVPLAIYLLSFIICFDADGWYRREVFLPLLAPALGGMAYIMDKGTEDFNLRVLLAVFSSGFLVACMVCHGEMVRLKPHPRYLTSFYLMLSIGGALGGIFVGLVAPYLFISYFELPISMVFCGFLAVVALVRDPRSRFYEGWATPPVVLMMAGVVALTVFCGRTVKNSIGNHNVVQRNFYGALRVRQSGGPADWDGYRTLLHGAINHGEQWIHPQRRLEILTYYCPDTGIGRAIHTRLPGKSQKVGVFGLGAGSIAAYGRPGDVYRFYEINPLVLRLAREQFFFIKDSRAKVEVALGDARLSLEAEPDQRFDVLAVDCFSGDSIPVHLLTREAIALYFKHLGPEGILALHVSNRFLYLEYVAERVAHALGKATLLVETEEDEEGDCFGTTWVLLADARVFEKEAFAGSNKPVPARSNLRIWTDDYSSLFEVLK